MEVADRKALAQCTEEAGILAEQLKSAREGGDAERAEKLEEELEALARYLGSGRSLRGTPRRLGDRANQLRDRVGHSVRDSFRKILGRNPELAEHLQASIKLRRQCGYFPASHVHWTF